MAFVIVGLVICVFIYVGVNYCGFRICGVNVLCCLISVGFAYDLI